MSARHLAVESSGTAARPLAAQRALDALSSLYRTWKNRRAFIRLTELSDAELADIGLARADLDAAVGVPLGGDPTERLGLLAADRRAGIGAAARRAA